MNREFESRLRDPSGRTSNPFVLMSGAELTGKTFAAVLLSASPRIGPAWMQQLGETDGDPYGAIRDGEDRPVRFKLVEHDGTWRDIVEAAEQIHAAGCAAVAAGDGTVTPLWIFDSATIEWEMLSRMAEMRAETSEKNAAALAKDPHAEIVIGHSHWNGANRRHNRLVRLWKTFPGVVIVTGRGKWATKFNAAGQPTRDREWVVEVQKSLPYAATVHVRLSQDRPATILNARMARNGIVPGVDKPIVVGRDRRAPDPFSLDWLIFDYLGYDPADAAPRVLTDPVPDADPDIDELAETAGVSARCAELRIAVAQAQTTGGLADIWETIKEAMRTEEITVAESHKLRIVWQDKGLALGMRRPSGMNGRRA